MAKFSGEDFQPERDQSRLARQIDRVRLVMEDGKWRTVQTIQRRIEQHFEVLDPENSIQAQLRNLRKTANGGYEVKRKRVTESGLYKYALGKQGANKKFGSSLETQSRAQLVEIIRRQRRIIRRLKHKLGNVAE